VTGNWQFSSNAASASRLAALSGALTGTGAALNGILHSDSATSCIAPGTPITVAGTTNSVGLTTLTGQIAGGTLTITGNLEAKAGTTTATGFADASYTVSGGACAFTSPAQANGVVYSPITGTFTGNFYDGGTQPVISITSTLTQSPASDPNGNFTLSGTATFPTNPCFASPVAVMQTQVSGGSFTLTYADTVNALNTVTASGTFSPDGTTLTVTNWTLTGPCGPDGGTGLLQRM
jgi:hypothetical protein